MRVIGVDPGSRATGWGVIERAGNKLHGIDAGVIRANVKAELHTRICTIYQSLNEIMSRYEPEVLAIEDVFFAPRYAQAALQLGHARGVVMLAAAERGMPVHSYAPAVVKRAIAGHGRAEKPQVARMVQSILGWKKITQTDTTDALAIALTHLSTFIACAVSSTELQTRPKSKTSLSATVRKQHSLPRYHLE